MSRIKLNEGITCADGFKMSVQANEGAFCTPRINEAARYSAVEVGYPNREEPLLMEYMDGGLGDDPTNTVYGFVPSHLITTICAKHGGVVSGELPPGVVLLSAHE